MRDLEAVRGDPVAFVREVLVNPATGDPFELYPAEERFLREGLTPSPDGSLPYPELIFSAPKKSGKTAFAAIGQLYVVVALGGPYAEGYDFANDLDQSVGRVFTAAVRIVEASPLLSARILADRIEFPSTGSFIQAIASDYAGAAGANPNITVFDELWGYTSERSRRLWDEMVPVPTRKPSVRLVVTYAGFSGESELLEELYKRGLKGEEIAPALYRQPGMLMLWSHEPVAPWQTPEWIEQMRTQPGVRRNAFLRQIENRFVSSEGSFVEMDSWDACVDPELRPSIGDRSLHVWVGVDAGWKRDQTAIVACTFEAEEKRVRVAWHRTWQPSPDDPLDFEATIEETLLDLQRRFSVREVRFDPRFLEDRARRLAALGLPMSEFPQTVPNLTDASSRLVELIEHRNLRTYPDAEMRMAISRSVAVETTRGWRIAKEKASHKIDVVVALAMAALGAIEGQSMEGDVWDAGSVHAWASMNEELFYRQSPNRM